ncbi:Fc.00g085070.m01.CDS01 [Cosmosporella sp. VM-42]
MASPAAFYPLRQTPLHLIAEILAQLDSMQQLGVAVLSHRIFFDAFNQRRHFIIGNIIGNQIPPDELYFAIMLFESTQIDTSDADATRNFLTGRSEAVLGDVFSPLAKLSASDATIISRNHTAVDSLIQDYVVERQLCNAFDEVAAHEVDWGERPIDWVVSPYENSRLQEFLCQGLPFLSAMSRAKSYDERVDWLSLDWFEDRDLSLGPSEQRRNLIRLDHVFELLQLPEPDTPLKSYEHKQLRLLERPLDGEQEGIESSPFRMWLSSHLNCPIHCATFIDVDRNLWECGYVFWDHDESQDTLQARCDSLRAEPVYFNRQYQWSMGDVLRSQSQRADIYLAGGGGYWPGETWPDDGLDFSKIKGLSDKKKAELVEQWKREFALHPG